MHISPVTSAVTSIFGALAVLVWRVREGRSAVTLKKILIPPAGMATGFCMFIVPAFRFPARGYFNTIMTIEQTGGLFFVLAFGMILRWRMSMYFEYRALTAQP